MASLILVRFGEVHNAPPKKRLARQPSLLHTGYLLTYLAPFVTHSSLRGFCDPRLLLRACGSCALHLARGRASFRGRCGALRVFIVKHFYGTTRLAPTFNGG